LKALVLFASTLPTSALAALKALLPAGKQQHDFITHNPMPLALETSRHAFGQGPITAIDQFFVRNNLPMPETEIVADRDRWSIQIKGCETPGQITLADLKKFETTTVASVLQCSGNGRTFFSHNPSGSPWGVGAAGCALWTGVKVSEVLSHFEGAEPRACFLTATGAESLPAGIDVASVGVERSVPLEKGLRDALLVWEMNGEPLPLVHGGPVRLLVPGYLGVNNVKWVKTLAATAEESVHAIQQSGYRLRPVGQAGNASHPSMYRMPVKSWINGPGGSGDRVYPGQQQIFGVAFSGERGIQHVDVSIDGGKRWQRATLYGPDLGPNAWRTFQTSVDLTPGDYTFVSRATDTAGDTQPEHFSPNQRGYGHNGWRDHGLSAQISTQPRAVEPNRLEPPPPASLQTPATALSQKSTLGMRLFTGSTQPSCATCHTLEAAGAQGVIGPNLDVLRPNAQRIRAALEQGVGAMPSYANQLSDTEIDALIDFITRVH
jgi:DMSO/TMAO reductase YedYZ molybdopterin-dependent catalytic subunit/mono/diheme cytochrome c family protein